MNLTSNHRKLLAQKIINNFDNYEYEIDKDKKIINIKDNTIHLSISENEPMKIQLKINDLSIDDENEFWDGFYGALDNYIENDIKTSLYHREMETLQKLNEYLS